MHKTGAAYIAGKPDIVSVFLVANNARLLVLLVVHTNSTLSTHLFLAFDLALIFGTFKFGSAYSKL